MAKNEHETSLPSIEEGVTVTGKVKKKAAHLQCAKVTKGTVNRWTNRGVQIGQNLRMLIGQLGGRTNQVDGRSEPSVRILIQI